MKMVKLIHRQLVLKKVGVEKRNQRKRDISQKKIQTKKKVHLLHQEEASEKEGHQNQRKCQI
ncbi:hypothetical protein ECANGB1_2011 [Enterospora canceri]|uniref:Uncharacterized protein n=1 Tax=Enterospora canceri TaxID=1081671 RepID=A0A1Y1S3T9_9MICR|nr:hypothetical protein ECANGB1_2011 [Enterospora canceri]